MQQILITGTNRGLGLEFVRQYLDRGDRVYATCRSPESATILQDLSKENSSLLTIIELEVTNENLLDKCVKVVESHTTHLDLLLNVAGVSPEGEDWDNLSVETMLETFHINSVAPLIIANRVHHLLNEAAEPKIVNLSSGQGSLHNKRSGGKYSYGSSK
ncbi:MAG: SDR family NAD(P)-dependent oxidoreductase, partial [Anaerolineales bacterium]|nr:SDR family NAD(P)-dependent oxidoreductase [Anaerolineales bacterium]